MVSGRCKMAVKEVLKKLGLHYISVDLGEIEIIEQLTDDDRMLLRVGLAESGLELMDDKRASLVVRIKGVIIEMVYHSDEIIKINFSDYISEKMNLDYTYLANLFSEVQGTTIEQFIISHKVERIKELIIYEELNITEIAWKMNYSSVAHLSNQFKKVTGLSPTHFKQLKDKHLSPIEEKEKHAAESIIANGKFFWYEEKEKRAVELFIVNEEMGFQNKEKEKRIAELTIENIELTFENEEKGIHAAELNIAIKELTFQTEEKEKRAEELIIANLELHKAEDAIRILNEDLEKKVIELTAELLAIDKELESFSYSISHNLRATMHAAHGYIRMLKKDCGDELNPEANRMTNNIINNSKKMALLIDDLLTFSRIGRRELVKVDIQVMDMVSYICTEIKKENKNRKLEIKMDDLPSVQGDTVAIKQVWVNLLSNALKYSKLNKLSTIHIGFSTNISEVIYFIKDNGAGFDMHYANKLFGLFQKLHTDETFEGTGVGLAIVHRIISKHGGRVWAEGIVNGGATFYFSLPKTIIWNKI